MENTTTSIYGTWEPKCKIRFSTAEIDSDMDYIAVPAHELVELIAAEMSLCALESGGVDNWSAFGWAMSDYLEECKHSHCYDPEKLRDYAFIHKSSDETIEEYIEDMSIKDFAAFEVWLM